jgi:hypothetical protein
METPVGIRLLCRIRLAIHRDASLRHRVRMVIYLNARLRHRVSMVHVGRIATRVRRGSGWRHMTQVLRIAAGHLHDFRTHERESTVALLPTAVALFANGKRNLVGRAARFAGATECMSGHEKERRIVIHRAAKLAAKLGDRFSESREGLRQDLEPQDVPRRGWMTRLTRPVTETVPRHEVFDLAHASPSCDPEPLMLVLGHRHAGEFPHGRPVEGAVSQSLVELGQALERFRHAQTLAGPARCVSEESFDVLRESREAKLMMGSGFKSSK